MTATKIIHALCPLPVRVAALVTVLHGCSGEDTTSVAGAEPSNPVVPGPEALGSAYALSVAVWSDSGPTGYVSVSDRLDRGDVSLESALEAPGYPSIQPANGQLLIANNEALSIGRFDVSADLDLVRKDTLSFVGQGVEGVLFGQQYWHQDNVAYQELEVTRRVLWNPLGFEIQGLAGEPPIALQRDGLDLFAAFNRTGYVSEGDVVVPMAYHDQDWIVWGHDTQLAIYDVTTHAVKTLVAAPCPGLDSITQDENGNKYLGTWEYSSLSSLIGAGAAPCVVRLTPDNTLDATWNTDLTSLTGGRLLKNFRYLGRGKAVAGVLHAEEYGEGYDFTRFKETAEDFWSDEGRYHRLWMIDLEANAATPVTGIEFDFVQPYFSHAVLDGRFFVIMASGDSNQAARSIVYELDDDAHATRLFEVPGEAGQWVKIR